MYIYTVHMEMNYTYTQFREKLSSIMEAVDNDSAVCEVTRRGHEPMVMLSKRDYDSIMETFHLIKSEKNFKRIKESFNQAKNREMVGYDPKTGEFLN